MKKIVLAFLFFSTWMQAQQYDVIAENKAYRDRTNKEFHNREKSPLKASDLYRFTRLPFYDINTDFAVKAIFTRTPAETPFMMKTTTARKPIYIKYGYLSFEIGGKKYHLNVYQNIDFQANIEEKNKLFIPFTDLTNGKETYGGGRYLDLDIPTGKNVTLDFNMAYNPFCAYNEEYSCPIPPKENHLALEVKAGMKKFKDE